MKDYLNINQIENDIRENTLNVEGALFFVCTHDNGLEVLESIIKYDELKGAQNPNHIFCLNQLIVREDLDYGLHIVSSNKNSVLPNGDEIEISPREFNCEMYPLEIAVCEGRLQIAISLVSLAEQYKHPLSKDILERAYNKAVEKSRLQSQEYLDGELKKLEQASEAEKKVKDDLSLPLSQVTIAEENDAPKNAVANSRSKSHRGRSTSSSYLFGSSSNSVQSPSLSRVTRVERSNSTGSLFSAKRLATDIDKNTQDEIETPSNKRRSVSYGKQGGVE